MRSLSFKDLAKNKKTGHFHGSFLDLATYYPFILFSFVYFVWAFGAVLGVSHYFMPLPDLYLDILEGIYYVATGGYAFKTWKSPAQHKRPGHLFVLMWGVALAAIWASELASVLGISFYAFKHSSVYIVFCRVASVIVAIWFVKKLLGAHHEADNGNGI